MNFLFFACHLLYFGTSCLSFKGNSFLKCLWDIFVHKSHSSFCHVYHWPSDSYWGRERAFSMVVPKGPTAPGSKCCLVCWKALLCFSCIQTRTWTVSFSLRACLASFPEIEVGGWQRFLACPSATAKPSPEECPRYSSCVFSWCNWSSPESSLPVPTSATVLTSLWLAVVLLTYRWDSLSVLPFFLCLFLFLVLSQELFLLSPELFILKRPFLSFAMLLSRKKD